MVVAPQFLAYLLKQNRTGKPHRMMSPFVDEEAYNEYRIREVEMPPHDHETLIEYGNAYFAALESHSGEVDHAEDRLFDFRKYEDVDFAEGELPSEPKSLFIMEWVQRSNEVISGLNVVVHDLLMLRDLPYLFGRPYSVRITFLLRSYTHEFFRMKELFNIFSKDFYKEGIITKDDLEESRRLFYDAFVEMLSFRNMLLHQLTNWNDSEYHDLAQLEAMGEHILKNTATGKTETGKQQMRNLCGKYLEIASEEGNRLSTNTTNTIALFSELLHQHERQVR